MIDNIKDTDQHVKVEVHPSQDRNLILVSIRSGGYIPAKEIPQILRYHADQMDTQLAARTLITPPQKSIITAT